MAVRPDAAHWIYQEVEQGRTRDRRSLINCGARGAPLQWIHEGRSGKAAGLRLYAAN